MVRCDGSVGFVEEAVDTDVRKGLATRAGETEVDTCNNLREIGVSTRPGG